MQGILWALAALCLGYLVLAGVTASFRISLLWGWAVAAAYFAVAALLPPAWQRPALLPFLLYLVFFALFLRKSEGKTATAPGDVILVLGSRTDGAMPSRLLESRAARAYGLAKESDVPLVLSGGAVGRETAPEGELLKRRLLSLGVAEERLLVEGASRTTWENLVFSAPLLKGATDVTVVTHAFHRRRVLALWQKALPGTKPSFAAVPGETGLLTLHLLIRESFTFLVDLIHGRASL